jgi:heavy metal translocating P-type ATPase
MTGREAASSLRRFLDVAIVGGTLAAIAAYLALRAAGIRPGIASLLLLAAIVLGGLPLLWDIARGVSRGDLGADLLAGLSIIVSVVLGEYLAGALVVFMLATGAALERFAVKQATGVLQALARRLPAVAHRKNDATNEDVPLEAIRPGDRIAIFPHEASPVDGVVIEGHSTMDESYLTGEPFRLSKTPGTEVLSGAVNGDGLLLIRALRGAEDSRYAKITRVMRATEQKRPELRRLGDRLGALYVPVALGVAGLAWFLTGDPHRFFAVLVVATPCPLLIGIPVAILGAISLAARRSIVIRDPAVLERLDSVRTVIFDKTGTLTYGEPRMTDRFVAPGHDPNEVLALVASVERYSKHPLAGALLRAAQDEKILLRDVSQVDERPGEGLVGRIAGQEVRVTGRKGLKAFDPAAAEALPPSESGLECVIGLDGRFAALYRFHDAPRNESVPFIRHLPRKHALVRTLLVSGDRESEVAYLARELGITEVHAGKSPEEKVAIVTEETRKAPTLFLGDGINDAPALLAATVGVAFGHRSEVTAEAAGAVIMEDSLTRVDELFHIARRLRTIALQSALGGMLLSIGGMALAALGILPPVAGALVQEGIDLLAILNALRMALPPGKLSDF